MTELLNNFLTGSAAWGVLLTLAAFGLGALINRVTGKAIFNPLLLGSIFVIVFLSVCNIPYGKQSRKRWMDSVSPHSATKQICRSTATAY